MIAIDTETEPVTDAEPCPRIVSVAVRSATQPKTVMLARDAKAWIVAALQFGWLGANVPFDMYVCLREWPDLLPNVIDAYQNNRVWDCLTAEKMIDSAEGFYRLRGGYDLGSVAQRRGGIVLNKESQWRLQFGLLRDTPVHLWPRDAWEYAADDVEGHWLTAMAQMAHPYADLIFRDRGRQKRGGFRLYEQTLRGVHVDGFAVDNLERKAGVRTLDLQLRLYAAGLARIGGTKAEPKVVKNTKVAMQMLWEHASRTGAPLTATKKGVSLNADALEAANLPPGHPLRDYQVYGTIQTQVSKNIPPFQRAVRSSGLVRTRYDDFVSTGRSSSSAPDQEEWNGTNFQNLPTPWKMKAWGLTCGKRGCTEPCCWGFRECLIPPPGMVWVIADWGGLELVPLAQTQLDWFGRSAMADALRAGKCLHRMFACTLLQARYDDYDPENPEHKQRRDIAKKWNFGRGGGMGDTKFQLILARDGIHMPLGQIKEYNQEWLLLWPEIPLYFDHISGMKGSDGWITIALPRTGLIRGRCSFTEACNFPFQGTAGAAMKDALWDLWLAGLDPENPLHGSYQAIVVHDENVTASPIDKADAALVEQEQIMKAAVARVCPDVPVKVESSKRERYCK